MKVKRGGAPCSTETAAPLVYRSFTCTVLRQNKETNEQSGWNDAATLWFLVYDDFMFPPAVSWSTLVRTETANQAAVAGSFSL